MTSAWPASPAAGSAVGPVAWRCRCGESARGATLLEVVVVVAIVGLVALVALPSYRQYALRAQRTDAKTALLKLQTNQERFYLTHHRYARTDELAALGFGDPARSDKGAYAITVPVATADTYTAVATPTPGGAFDMTRDTDCTSFTITAEGLRGATSARNAGSAAAAAERCW